MSKIALGIYALVGAVGFALLKENKHNQREIVKMSQKYMLRESKKQLFNRCQKKTTTLNE
ncbi:DUF5392 family protein [[Brevibacterium] frigoritolerans]|uniref:DUF5392 family protein n=1 Tax=Peribacillus frigoritolerans TaxID=450367 RepID=A0A941FJS8_9BACI|nr:DUF5392 family protein [Peribacillus frigoritolerans]